MLYFFFDVDGTLLPFGQGVPESTRQAISMIRERGGKSFLATGRSLVEIPPAIRSLGFDGGVYSAGATVMAEGKCIFSRRMSSKEKSVLLDFCREKGFRVLMQSDDGTYVRKEDLEYWQSLLLKHVGRLLDIPGLLATDEIPSSMIKLLYICSEEGMPIEKVAASIPEGFSVVANTVGLPPELMGEVVLSDITKATGIDTVLDFYGGSISEAVAVGDGANDIEMVSHAGIGIAMGNATPSLKAVASYITDDVSSDGLFKAVEYAFSLAENG